MRLGESPFADLVELYPKRTPRTSLDAVEDLIRRLGLVPPARTVVVVGTNGKTSTATYLARIFSGTGLVSGLVTSPHVFRWTERVRIDDAEVGEAELVREVRRADEAAAAIGREELRFFDLLTVASLALFRGHGVEAGVFEAGIGGRLDATRCLRAPLVVLTSVDLDHTELLGSSREEILREKLMAAPAGARVVSAPLGAELEQTAHRLAAELELAFEFVDVGRGGFRERNLRLAQHAAGPLDVDLGVRGRFERHTLGGVDVVVDAAHNEEGWRTLLAELPASFVAVVSISADRPPDALTRLLDGRARTVVATCAWRGRSLAAQELAGRLRGDVRVEDDPVAAVRTALELARDARLPLAAFGSSYFVPHVLLALGVQEPAA